MTTVTADIPEKLEFLFHPARYKIAYGGRGSAKSWSFARAAIIKAIEKKRLILCCREVQNSIAESVHRLLGNQIEIMGLSDYFHITDNSIKCPYNGSEFIFKGLLRNIKAIKSLEGVDICWVEEAETISDESLNVLIPTIRKEGDDAAESEIWFSFNTGYEDDPVYERFVTNTPDGAIVKLVNYYDNPWFNETLRKEMERDKARDYQEYQNIWMGKPRGKGGRVWPGFDKIHIQDTPWDAIKDKGNCFMAMDPHAHYYPFCLWIAVFPKNDRGTWPEDFYKHVYAEWPTFDDLGGYYHDLRKKAFYTGTLEDMARQIYAKDGVEHGLKVQKRFIDTRFAKGSGSWNWSTSTEGIIEQFAKNENGGLRFDLPSEKAIDAQRQVIKQDMTYNELIPVSQFNKPSFSVSPACGNVIASLKSHRLEEDSERESEKYKDPSDGLRIGYAGLSEFNHIIQPQRQAVQPRSGGWMG